MRRREMEKLLDAFRPDPGINEANSGYVDHRLHKNITNDILNSWMTLLNSIEDKKSPLDTEDQILYLPKSVAAKGQKFSIKHEKREDDLYFDSHETFLAKLYIDGKQNKKDPILGASVNLEATPKEVWLRINQKFSVDDILKQKDIIENMANHEATHIIKMLQGVKQKRNSDKGFYYLNNTHEIHAHIAELNSELKSIKHSNPNISFEDALKQTKVWDEYNKFVFKENPKIRNKILSKISHYWKTL